MSRFLVRRHVSARIQEVNQGDLTNFDTFPAFPSKGRSSGKQYEHLALFFAKPGAIASVLSKIIGLLPATVTPTNNLKQLL
jgi:hypothetical protein